MKKKLVLVAILLVIGGILFLEYICKISVLVNIEKFIDKQNKMSDSIEESITKLDITGILPGAETKHEHLYKTMYDENKHWEECMVCGKIQNEKTHSFTKTWNNGKNTCLKENYCTEACTCGYSNKWKKPCVWDGKKYYTNSSQRYHTRACMICKNGISDGDYYLNIYDENSQLYSGIVNTEHVHPLSDHLEKCYKADGTEITCSNLGTCVVCGYSYTLVNSVHDLSSSRETKINGTEKDYQKGKIQCNSCKKEYGIFENFITTVDTTPLTYVVTSKITLTNGAIFKSTQGMRNAGQPWQKNEQIVTKINDSKTEIELRTVAQFIEAYKEMYEIHLDFIVNIDGKNTSVLTSVSPTYPVEQIPSDVKEPIISSIVTENDDTLTVWSKTKPIVISGIENWTNTVTIQIIDNQENNIFYGTAVVTNGSYTISCTPELEVDASGKRFKAIVTDACNNKTEQEFEIARVDAIAPRITSGDELGGDWAKSKKIIFSANDYGIGEVQIGFNSSDDYELAVQDGQSFSREYELFGDVYEPREANVYYKDGLGNISTKKIIIDKLDNTVPTITNVNIHNNKLTVEANDINETWGEGSGVVKYRYLPSGEKIENIDESILINEVGIEENIVIPNLPEVKYVYVVAEDLVRKHKQNI